jgi:oxalate decarboxylase/phosphoglucose isomerase-like protein (cupin superfamily)
MHISTPQISFEDDRGAIKDVLVREPIDAITIIRSKKGVVRGNHYHKDTTQWVYVQSGQLQSLTQKENELVVEQIVNPGDLIVAESWEKHTLVAIQDSEFFVFTRGPRGGDSYENDTFRLETPLQPPK